MKEKVHDGERVQLLQKLLVRVRENAEARPLPGRAIASDAEAVLLDRPMVVENEDEIRAWPAAGARTSFPDQEMTEDEGAAFARRIDPVDAGAPPPRSIRRSSRPPRGTEPLAIAERGVQLRLRADRWSVLLDDHEEAPLATFASEAPPPPLNPTIEEKWRDREPEGALERAVQNAAHERASQRGAIWIDLVAELRERRGPTSRPAEPEATSTPLELVNLEEAAKRAALSPEPDATSADTVADTDPLRAAEATRSEDEALPMSTRPSAPPVARSLTPAPFARDQRPLRDTLRPSEAGWTPHPDAIDDVRRSAPPSTLSPPSRRLRRRAQRWSYAKRLVSQRGGRFPAAARAIALVAAVGIVAVVIAVAWFRNPPQPLGATTTQNDSATRSLSTASPGEHRSPDSPSSAPQARVPGSASPNTSASSSPPDALPSEGLTAEEGAPPDTPSLPESSGYLYVASPAKIPVYLNGIIAGETQHWMKVGCGWHYLRLARRGSPPVGSSFPVWATVGRSVMVPCRGATRVELAEDPGPVPQ